MILWLTTACTFSEGQGFSELTELTVDSLLPASWTTDLGYVIEIQTATVTVTELALMASEPEEEEEEGHAHEHEEHEEEHEEHEHEVVWVEGGPHDWRAGGPLVEGPVLPSSLLPRVEISEAVLLLDQLSVTGTVAAGPRSGPLTVTLDLDLALTAPLALSIDEHAPEAVSIAGTLVPSTTWLDGIAFQEMAGTGAVINPSSPEAASILEDLSQMTLELQWTPSP